MENSVVAVGNLLAKYRNTILSSCFDDVKRAHKQLLDDVQTLIGLDAEKRICFGTVIGLNAEKRISGWQIDELA